MGHLVKAARFCLVALQPAHLTVSVLRLHLEEVAILPPFQERRPWALVRLVLAQLHTESLARAAPYSLALSRLDTFHRLVALLPRCRPSIASRVDMFRQQAV